MRASDTRHGRYEGPPGDAREYWMPRDHAIWEKAWADHLGQATPEPIDATQRRGEAGKPDPERKRRHDEAMAWVREYTGSWAFILDIRASERWGTKYMKLSDRQVEVILDAKARDEERLEMARLNTELFADDEYLSWRDNHDAQGRSALEPSTGEAPRLEAQPASGQGSRGDVADGWYLVDGEPWKVQWNRERSRKYAKRLERRPDSGDTSPDRDAGHHPAAGDWVYVPGGLGIVAQRGEPMTLEVAQQYGKLYGICAICGATLTDERSIADGIGPVCKSKLA